LAGLPLPGGGLQRAGLPQRRRGAGDRPGRARAQHLAACAGGCVRARPQRPALQRPHPGHRHRAVRRPRRRRTRPGHARRYHPDPARAARRAAPRLRAQAAGRHRARRAPSGAGAEYRRAVGRAPGPWRRLRAGAAGLQPHHRRAAPAPRPVTSPCPPPSGGYDPALPAPGCAGRMRPTKGRMDMFDKYSRSWELVKASASVLRSDKELMLFPVISGLATLLVAATFLLPAFALNVFADGFGLGAAVLAFLFYFVQYSVIIFFNCALVGAAMIRLEGGDPTLADGFRIARSRLPAILGYAAIAATVGVLLQGLKQKDSFLVRLMGSALGAAWTLATFLVVPVLVS